MSGEANQALELDELKARYEKAMDHVCALAEGTARWKMTIPAEPESDSDLLLTRALGAVPVLIAEVERLTQERDTARDIAVALEQELALKDQALDEIKHALEIGTWPGYGLTVERIQRILTRLDTQGETK